MVIQTNIAALNAQRNLGVNNAGVSKNLEKLASGYQVNRAGDNAAGLAISEKMRGQIRGLGMAEQNVTHSINLIQTAEGALNETHAILHRMRELAVQASNGTYQNEDRAQIEEEFQALKGEVDRINESTQYNGMRLFGDEGDIRTEKAAADWSADPTWTTMMMTAFNSNTWITTSPGANGNFTGTIRFYVDVQVTPDGTGLDINILSQEGSGYTVSVVGPDRIRVQQGNVWLETRIVKDDFVGGYAGGVMMYQNPQVVGASNSIGFQAMGQFEWIWGEYTEDFAFQIGANGSSDQNLDIEMRAVNSTSLGIAATDVASRQNANDAIALLDDATNQVSSFRAQLGALQNRLGHTLNNLGVTKENLTAAESSIRDTDMAKEMMEFTKQSILVQAAQSMLAQANTLPQGILSLLR